MKWPKLFLYSSMLPLIVLSGFPILANTAHAQIVVLNPHHLPVPEQKLRLLDNIIYRVVAKEFHLRKVHQDLPLIVVLGERNDGLVGQANGPSTIYLARWDEASFVMWDMRVAMQNLVFRDHWNRMEASFARHYAQIAPATTSELALHKIIQPAVALPPTDDCLSALVDSRISQPPCGPLRDGGRGKR